MDSNRLVIEAQLEIFRPAKAIFEAIVDPDHMASYFISRGDKRLDGEETVTWEWDDHQAKLKISPSEIVPFSKVSFTWEATNAPTNVEISLTDLDDNSGTMVKVTESEWENNPEGIGYYNGNTQGWMHMLCCLKAYLEFGINLRKGKKPE